MDQLAGLLEVPEEEAFLRLVHQLVTGIGIRSLDEADVTEGGQDKQVDVMTFVEAPDHATVFIIQAKHTDSFSSNALIGLHNGLEWVVNRRRADVGELTNVAFKDKIIEYRSLVNSLGPSNIEVAVRFATYGHTAEISDEFKQELRGILAEFDNGTFERFSCEPVGADELVALMERQEKHERRIDAEIRIRYDTNNPSLIKYFSEDLQGLVCSVPASEIARLVNEDPEGAIFDMNVRRFLGMRGGVNRDIQGTCTNADDSHLFWFLNNGITIVCDELDAVTDPDNAHIKMKNMQIVNGCQTATTLALAQNAETLARDVRVVVRVYETKDTSLVDKIVLTTNNQNRISNRDLRSNDQVQRDFERGFAIHDYYYERKPGQFSDQEVDQARILPNELIGQAYLAVVLKKPSDARTRKYKVWGEHYERIFADRVVEPYITSALLVRAATGWVRDQGLADHVDDTRRGIAKRGVFHLSRIAAYKWRESDSWSADEEELQRDLLLVQEDPGALAPHFESALDVLVELVEGDEDMLSDIDVALKSTLLDSLIDKALHS